MSMINCNVSTKLNMYLDDYYNDIYYYQYVPNFSSYRILQNIKTTLKISDPGFSYDSDFAQYCKFRDYYFYLRKSF
jgi:hypothetical protein